MNTQTVTWAHAHPPWPARIFPAVSGEAWRSSLLTSTLRRVNDECVVPALLLSAIYCCFQLVALSTGILRSLASSPSPFPSLEGGVWLRPTIYHVGSGSWPSWCIKVQIYCTAQPQIAPRVLYFSACIIRFCSYANIKPFVRKAMS